MKFAAFILSHGRATSVITFATLRKQGYDGPIFIVIDNEDIQGDQYREKYGDQVVVFDKKKYAEATDNYDNFKNYRSTTHVRNAIFDIAKTKGVEAFVMLDDDYSFFCYKFNRSLKYGDWLHKRSLGTSFLAVVDFLKSCPKITSIAFAQQGDFIGGPNGGFSQAVKTKRKTMNSFFCLTARRFNFVSRLNEDVNTYMTLGMRGEIFLTINQISLNQQTTQANAGGMTEAYLSSGTYVKSFYTVMAMPSSTKIMPMGWTNPRLHHRISWNNSVPKIIDGSHKKI